METHFIDEANEILKLKKQLEQASAENTELYDFNAMIYVTIDSSYLIQRVNFKASHFFNVDRITLQHQLFLNYLTEHSKHIVEKTIQTLFNVQFKQTCEIELLQKGGEKKQVLLECMLLKNKCIRLGLTDITYTRQLESQLFELNKSSNMLHHLIQNVSDAIAVLDHELHIKIINPSFIRLFSDAFSMKAQVGMNIRTILADFPESKNKIILACQDAMLGHRSSILLENTPHANQAYYCYEIITRTIDYPHVTPKKILLHLRNLTNLQHNKKIEHQRLAALALASRTTAMGEMASAFAHEITQPLAAINAYTQSCLFILKNNLQDQQTNHPLLFPLEQISRQAENAGEILHHMNNFMRDDLVMMEETDLNLLIHETLTILYYETLHFKLKISLDLMEGLPKVMCNRIHMMQILLNLGKNSIESLKSSPQEHNEIIIKTRALNHTIFVRVMDNGPGIHHQLKHLGLASYFSTKPQGSGIGLGICRSLIEAHLGTLSVQKQRTHGARFTFTLPIKREPIV